MKKFIMLVLLLAFICTGYYITNRKGKETYKILYDTEEENAIIGEKDIAAVLKAGITNY